MKNIAVFFETVKENVTQHLLERVKVLQQEAEAQEAKHLQLLETATATQAKMTRLAGAQAKTDKLLSANRKGFKLLECEIKNIKNVI